jgi:hypothetical protein
MADAPSHGYGMTGEEANAMVRFIANLYILIEKAAQAEEAEAPKPEEPKRRAKRSAAPSTILGEP